MTKRLAFAQYGGSLLDLTGNKTDGYTVTLDDEIYYDATAQGYWSGGSVQPVYDLALGDLTDADGDPLPAGLYAIEELNNTATSMTGDANTGFVAITTTSLASGTDLSTLLAGHL